MLLRDLMRSLRSPEECAVLLASFEDKSLIQRLIVAAENRDEPINDYVAGAVARFAALAPEEAWLSLTTQLARACDPARTALATMAAWAAEKDRQEECSDECTCQGLRHGRPG